MLYREFDVEQTGREGRLWDKQPTINPTAIATIISTIIPMTKP